MSDLTIEQQRDLVARQIMGWKPKEVGGRIYYMSEKGHPQSWDQNWSPDTDLTQAMMLADEMQQKGLAVRLSLIPESGGLSYSCEAGTPGLTSSYITWADTLAQAIFTVAVQLAERLEKEAGE